MKKSVISRGLRKLKKCDFQSEAKMKVYSALAREKGSINPYCFIQLCADNLKEAEKKFSDHFELDPELGKVSLLRDYGT